MTINKNLIPVIIVVAFMIVAILYENRRTKNYYKKAIEIIYVDSLNVSVNFIRLNRGTLHFNNKYYLNNYKNTSEKIHEIWHLEVPVRLIKKSNNDTIKIISDNSVNHLIIDMGKVQPNK